MKKKISIIFLALALCLTAIFVTACGGKKTGEKTDYEWKYEKEFVDEHDADMTIDGELAEERWQGQQYLTHVQYGVTVNYTTIFTEKGLYIGAKAQDPDLKWNARFNFSHLDDNPANSAFWFNIKGPDVQDGHSLRAFNFFVDAFDSASRNQTRFEAKAKTNGDIMKFEATEMTAEFFASWDALNIDVSDGLPEFVRIIPYYRHVKDVADPNENKWIRPIFIYGNPMFDMGISYDENLQQGWYRPISGMKFGSVGYINADKPDAIIGDAANGYSKSSGWDMTDVDNGVVKAVGPDEQAIFFKGINSSKYMVSAKMKLIGGATHAGGWKNQYPNAGLINMRTETESISFYVGGRSILDGRTSWEYHTLDKYTSWNDVNEGYYKRPEGFNVETDTIDLKCIKYDENLFYFINGSLVLIKRVDWIQGDACPGLYGLSAEVEFSDFSATDYGNNADALKAIISEYAYNVSATAGDGGFVIIDKTALRKGDKLIVTVTPSAGYVLSSFTINGVDRYDYVVNNMTEGGKVVFTDIAADSDIRATFARLDGGVRVTGKITAEGKAVTTSVLTLTAPADKRVFYTSAPTSNGSFNFTLSPAGTYALGEKTITLDGNYVLEIKTSGYRDRKINITVNPDDKSVRVADVELEKNVVGGSVTVNGRTFDSYTDNWDMSGEADAVIYAEKDANGSLAYFTDKTGKDAVIDFTISNKTAITADGRYEEQPCMGVSLTDGSNRFEIFVLNEGLRISPKGWWDGGGEAYNVSVPVSYSLRAKETPENLTFRLVRSGSLVALTFKDGDDYVEIWRTRNATIEKMSAYAFTVCQSQPCRLEFSNYSIKVGDEAKDYIEASLYETVTLGAYDTTKGTVTIDGLVNGKIKYGETFTVNIDSDKTAIVTYGAKAEIVTGGGEVSFAATHSGEVTVAFADALVSATGTVSLDAAFGNGTVDYTKTELTFEGAGYTLTFSGAVKADGTFTVDLPSGEYKVSATNPLYYAKAKTVTVSAESATVAVKFDLSAIIGGNATYTVKTDGTLTGHTTGVGQWEFYHLGTAESFTVETTVGDLDFSVERWPQAGIGINTGGGNYYWTLFHNDNSDTYRVVFVRDNEYDVLDFGEVDVTNGVKLKVDYNGSVLKLYVGGAIKATYSQGDAFIKDNTFGGAISAMLVNCGTAGVFTDYRFIPREAIAADVEGAVTSAVAGAEAAGARITVLASDGVLEYNCFADENGKFRLGVSDGEYKIYATVAGKAASLAYTVKIENGKIVKVNGEDAAALNVVINKTIAGGALVYDAVSGTITGHETRNGYLYGAEVNYGEAFVLAASVKRQSVNWWPAIGLLIGQGDDNHMQFAIRKCCPDSGIYYDFFLRREANGDVPMLYQNYQFGDALRADAFGSDDTVKLTVVYYNGYYFVYLDETQVFTISENTSITGVALKDAIGTGKIKLGLFSEQTGVFTEWNYEIGKAAVEKYLGRTVTIPAGVTAKVGETEITDGKVQLGDTITLTMTGANRVTFSVDGTTVVTTENNGIYSASFAVTGNHTVTYEVVYPVTGKVERNDIYSDDSAKDIAATVIKAYKEGVLVGTFENAVNAAGEYEIELAAGEYTLEFENPRFMTARKAITVTEGDNTADDVTFTLAKVDGGWGNWVYDAAKASMTVPSNGDGAFKEFAGITGNRVLATMTVSNLDTQYDVWASAGFAIETQSGGLMYFSLTETVGAAGENGPVKIRILKILPDWAYIAEFGIGETNADYTAEKLTVCVAANSVYLYVNDTLRYTISETSNTDVYNVLKGVGFFAENASYKTRLQVVKPGEEVTVTAFDCTADSAIIDKFLSRTVTIPAGVTAKVGETEITDGKVQLGDTITLTMTGANRVTFSVDGTPIATAANGETYTATFVVTGNHAVTYEVAYAVSGTITKPDYVSGAAMNTTVIKATKDGVTSAIESAVSATGEYTIYLSAGTYTLRAENAAFMPVKRDNVVVTDSAVTGANMAFALAAPTDMNGLTFDENTQKLSNNVDITTYFGKGNDFTVTAYIDKITTDWKAAGLVIRDASKMNFVKFALRKRADGSYDIYVNLGDGYMECPTMSDPFTQTGARAKLTVARSGATLKVLVNDALYTEIAIADSTAVKHWGPADTKLTDYLSADGEFSFGLGTCDGTNATFSEWSYSLTE